MTWSNKKADCDNHIDRISDLPSHIIDDILQHLDIVEQVRTSILSRKWSFESGALERLVSGCPLLQGLTLLYCSGFECIDFSAPSLKVLKIFSYRVIKSICLKRPNNLIDLTLKDNWYNGEGGPISNLINCLPKIQRLVLGTSYNEILSVGTILLMLRRSFSSLEYLKLFLNLDQTKTFRYIVCLLESAPNLVELVIQEGSYYYFDTQVPYDSAELKCSSWRLSQLRMVKITVRDDRFQLAVSLIRLILANSSSLETLTFRVGIRSQLDESILSCISQYLLLMERASPRAKTVFLQGEKFYDGSY